MKYIADIMVHIGPIELRDKHAHGSIQDSNIQRQLPTSAEPPPARRSNGKSRFCNHVPKSPRANLGIGVAPEDGTQLVRGAKNLFFVVIMETLGRKPHTTCLWKSIKLSGLCSVFITET